MPINTNRNVKVIYGNTETNPELILGSTGVNMNKNGSYVVVDLGAEVFVNKIAFGKVFSGQNDKLIISSKSFVGDNAMSSPTIREINLSQEDGSTMTIACGCYTRLIIFKHEGLGTLTVRNLVISLGFIHNLIEYGTGHCLNPSYLFYDENIKTASDARVSTFKQSQKYAVVVLGEETSTVPVVQVTFNALTTKTTLFKLQKKIDTDFLSTETVDPTTGWTDVKTFRVVDYDRLPDMVIGTNGIDKNGMVVTGNSDYLARFMNNGLVGYMFRPDLSNDIFLTVIESWSDGSQCYIRVNADVRELGIVPGMKYFLERPNIVTFPLTSVNALQLVQISGGETKVNGFKAYVNLLGTTNNAIVPSSGSTLAWSLQLESI